MIPAYPIATPGLIDLVASINVRGVRRGGGPDKAPLCYIDDYANPPRLAPHVIFRAGSFSRHTRDLSLSCISRIRVVYPAATSGHPCGDELASRPLRCRAHIVVGTDERLRGQFRSKRTCRNRRRVLILECRLSVSGRQSPFAGIFFSSVFIVFDPEIHFSRPRHSSSPLRSAQQRGLGLLYGLRLWLRNMFPEANTAATR